MTMVLLKRPLNKESNIKLVDWLAHPTVPGPGAGVPKAIGYIRIRTYT